MLAVTILFLMVWRGGVVSLRSEFGARCGWEPQPIEKRFARAGAI